MSRKAANSKIIKNKEQYVKKNYPPIIRNQIFELARESSSMVGIGNASITIGEDIVGRALEAGPQRIIF